MNYRLAARHVRRALTFRPLALCGLALLAAFALSSAGGRAFGPTAAPATIIVNSLSDAVGNDGACTLREAITAATNDTASGPAPGECAAGSGDDTINFTVTGTINLNAQQLSIASTNLNINGPGSNLLTVRRDTGGLYRVLFINAATVNISGLTISNGLVPAGGGAGGGMINGGTTTMTDVVVTGNRSSGGFSGAPNGGDGGGINNSGILTMTNCTVSNNFTGDGVLAGSGTNGAGGNGGGVANSGTLTMTNCTVSGNGTGNGPFKGGDGGGVYSTGTGSMTNVTIANNTVGGAGFGPGIITGGGIPFNVKNSIIARNGFTGTGPDIIGSYNSQGNNLIGTTDAGSGFTNGVNGDKTGTLASPLDPLLAPLGNYGGLTQTHALLPGSPAIDAGSSTGAPAQDQRGVSRVGAVDIGSFESRGFAVAATEGTPQSTTIKSAFAVQLKVTVTSAFGEPVSGGRITFAAPVGTGPSGTFSPNLSAVAVTLNGSGEAVAPVFTANGFAGSYNVTAGWSGVSSPATFSLTNNPAATTTSLSSSVNPSNFGQSVTFTASVTSAAGVPTGGTVQFKDNGTDLGSPVAIDAAGQVTITTTTLASGSHTITAVYSGDANFQTSNATLSGGQFVRPTISVSDVSVTEGDSGTVNAVFNVTLSAASTATVTVNFATTNDTATAPGDYTATSGTLTFDPGQTAKTVTVTVNGDISFEAGETFFVNLSVPSNATIADSQGVGTINNDDAEGGIIAFTSATFNTTEGSGSFTVTVQRTGDTTRAATVDYATSDLSASQRSDYILALGTLSFAPDETSKSFAVLINQDSYAEGTEAIALTLSNPGGGAVVGVVSTSTLEIADDVPESSGNPIDGSEAFVRQHYHDFLNREPDTGGLNFWTNGIESCGADAQCRTLKRIDTSAAFFLSIEFQETGFLVQRMYKAAYGDAVGQATIGGVLTNIPVPVVRLNEFLPDTQKIGKDVIVGTAGWPARLEANKNAFALDFVTRQRFTNAFGPGVAPEQFVDTLNANAGNVLSADERAALISELTANNTAAGRASVLRKVAEDPDLASAEFNRAFVLMQYFGYMRRNPNDAPDTNYGGYNFWLGKLNEFGGDFRRAQMVTAFLDSVEYRQRFGQN